MLQIDKALGAKIFSSTGSASVSAEHCRPSRSRRQMRLWPLQLPHGMLLYQSIFEPPGRAYISPGLPLCQVKEAASVTRPRVALISVARGRPAFI